MPRCPSCNRDIPNQAGVCPHCGEPSNREPGDATVTAAGSRAPQVEHRFETGGTDHGGGSSSDSLDHARFTPGTMLTKRYRIVGPLGKGGMGEVYRAEDLILRQPMALKFLAQNVADDPRRLECVLNEVRVARQVSHPNVCRVYDIGEVDGEHFISMQYVGGEDLASLIALLGVLAHNVAPR